jgi:CRP-like cAMP-binding protein
LQTRRKKTTIAHGDQMSSENMYSRIQKTVTQFLGKTRTLPIPRWISPQYHTTSISEIFGHASFLLVAISYAVDDFVQLRLIAIGGSSAMLVFTYFHPHGRVLWLPFKWNLLFTLINSYRVLKNYADRFFANQLDDLMLYMYDHHFYVMDKVDFAQLVRLGTTETFKKGEVLVGQGDDNRYIRLVLKGELNVERDGLTTYKLHQGNFISESGLHAGLLLRGVVCSCCSVIANDDDVVVLRWDRTELMYLVEFNKQIRRALKAVMSWDIVSKLKSQRSLLASGIVKDPEEWTRKRREQTLHRYRGILRNMLTHPEYLNKRKEELSKYRDIHHIDSVEHEQALKAMGWTEAEFGAGKKEGQIDEDLAEKKHYDWTSYAKNAYLRLFE